MIWFTSSSSSAALRVLIFFVFCFVSTRVARSCTLLMLDIFLALLASKSWELAHRESERERERENTSLVWPGYEATHVLVAPFTPVHRLAGRSKLTDTSWDGWKLDPLWDGWNNRSIVRFFGTFRSSVRRMKKRCIETWMKTRDIVRWMDVRYSVTWMEKKIGYIERWMKSRYIVKWMNVRYPMRWMEKK